jgi:hypothetical protein
MCEKERKKVDTQLNTMIDCCYCYVCDICLCAFLRLRHFSCRAVSTLSFKTAAHVLDSEKLQDCHLAICSHLTGSEGMLMYKTDHTIPPREEISILHRDINPVWHLAIP